MQYVLVGIRRLQQVSSTLENFGFVVVSPTNKCLVQSGVRLVPSSWRRGHIRDWCSKRLLSKYRALTGPLFFLSEPCFRTTCGRSQKQIKSGRSSLPILQVAGHVGHTVLGKFIYAYVRMVIVEIYHARPCKMHDCRLYLSVFAIANTRLWPITLAQFDFKHNAINKSYHATSSWWRYTEPNGCIHVLDWNHIVTSCVHVLIWVPMLIPSLSTVIPIISKKTWTSTCILYVEALCKCSPRWYFLWLILYSASFISVVFSIVFLSDIANAG